MRTLDDVSAGSGVSSLTTSGGESIEGTGGNVIVHGSAGRNAPGLAFTSRIACRSEPGPEPAPVVTGKSCAAPALNEIEVATRRAMGNRNMAEVYPTMTSRTGQESVRGRLRT